MSENNFTLTQARLRELLHYDPATGVFTRNVSTGGKAKAGTIAGSLSNRGYQKICVDYKMYWAHRLAWFYVRGTWPDKIDHKDGNPSNNSFDNLRDTNNKENQQNRISAKVDNRSSGMLGVSQYSGKWIARICVDGKVRYIGGFDTPEEASEAYRSAKRALHEGDLTDWRTRRASVSEVA